MDNIDSKERFGDRAENYAKFRPSYPVEALDYIVSRTGINKNSVIADIGSGTGKLTRLLLERGFSVTAAEPNENMRRAAEAELSGFPGFRSIAACAEETGFEPRSLDLITIAQAFHWFDRDICKAEFKRVLKPGGYVCIIYNRRETGPGFMEEYSETIKKLYDNYSAGSAQEHITPAVYNDFLGGSCEIKNFYWREAHGFEALLGRSLSNSHAPAAGHPNHGPLKAALLDLFNRYSENGAVYFEYKTEVVTGRLQDK